MSVERDQITKGATLSVIGTRHDRPIGSIARVSETSVLSIEKKWWFTVEWLTYPPKKSQYSLRVWEGDLLGFELVTGPVPIPLPEIQRRTRDPFTFKALSPQLFLPFTGGDRRRQNSHAYG